MNNGSTRVILAGPSWTTPVRALQDPLALLRFRGGRAVVQEGGDLAREVPGDPLAWIEGELARLQAAGREPIAAVAIAYEYAATNPLFESAFPPMAELPGDLLVAAVFGLAETGDGEAGTGSPGSSPPEGVPQPHAPMPLLPDLSPAAYERAVETIREYIAAGDIYQANLTLGFRGEYPGGREVLVARALAPPLAPYAALFAWDGHLLASLSPELLLRRRGRVVSTRPIKGTAPPGSHEALAQSAKDAAEHIMIVDLERNDLGQVCEPGSIRVDPMMQVVDYPGLSHIESEVHGVLRDGVTTADLVRAVFPGGSVTGAPKRRAMQVLAEVEAGPRGFYCGALGWMDGRGNAEFNLPIRTLELDREGRLALRAGGGIVHDSNAAAEWQEVLLKLNSQLQLL